MQRGAVGLQPDRVAPRKGRARGRDRSWRGGGVPARTLLTGEVRLPKGLSWGHWESLEGPQQGRRGRAPFSAGVCVLAEGGWACVVGTSADPDAWEAGRATVAGLSPGQAPWRRNGGRGGPTSVLGLCLGCLEARGGDPKWTVGLGQG